MMISSIKNWTIEKGRKTKRWLIAVLIGGTALAAGTTLVNDPVGGPTEVNPENKPIGIIVDMPESNPLTLYSRMQLLVAGGARERDVYVTVTSRTHPDNTKVIEDNPYVVKVTTINEFSKDAMENAMRTGLGAKSDRFIYALSQ